MILIGLSANRPGAGKDTFAKYLTDELNVLVPDISCLTFAWANAIKYMCARDFDFTENQMYGSEKDVPDERYPKQNEVDKWYTPREVLQDYGQFFVKFDKNYWINKVFIDFVTGLGHMGVINIITDCRRKNEVDYIKERNGLHVRLYRPYDTDSKISGRDHAIENVDLGHYNVDLFINNDKDLESLNKLAKYAAHIITTKYEKEIKGFLKNIEKINQLKDKHKKG